MGSNKRLKWLPYLSVPAALLGDSVYSPSVYTYVISIIVTVLEVLCPMVYAFSGVFARGAKKKDEGDTLK